MAEVLSATKQFKRLFQGTLDPTMSWDSEEELREYLKPRIQGEVDIKYNDGRPSYMNVPHLEKARTTA